eukprot:6196551-Pleurochrysis_carterae.AAC.1
MPRQPDAARPAPFKRTLGEYPLRSRAPAVLLTMRARRSKPQWGRGTGCAFAVNIVSTDPRSRMQAMAEDRIGWGAAKRAQIANHASTGSWKTTDLRLVAGKLPIVLRSHRTVPSLDSYGFTIAKEAVLSRRAFVYKAARKYTV